MFLPQHCCSSFRPIDALIPLTIKPRHRILVGKWSGDLNHVQYLLPSMPLEHNFNLLPPSLSFSLSLSPFTLLVSFSASPPSSLSDRKLNALGYRRVGLRRNPRGRTRKNEHTVSPTLVLFLVFFLSSSLPLSFHNSTTTATATARQQ